MTAIVLAIAACSTFSSEEPPGTESSDGGRGDASGSFCERNASDSLACQDFEGNSASKGFNAIAMNLASGPDTDGYEGSCSRVDVPVTTSAGARAYLGADVGGKAHYRVDAMMRISPAPSAAALYIAQVVLEAASARSVTVKVYRSSAGTHADLCDLTGDVASCNEESATETFEAWAPLIVDVNTGTGNLSVTVGNAKFTKMFVGVGPVEKGTVSLGVTYAAAQDTARAVRLDNALVTSPP